MQTKAGRTKFPPNTRKYSGKRPEKSEKACRREEKIWKRYLLNWGKLKWGIRSRSNIVWFPDGGRWLSSQKLGHLRRCWLFKLNWFLLIPISIDWLFRDLYTFSSHNMISKPIKRRAFWLKFAALTRKRRKRLYDLENLTNKIVGWGC